MLSYNEFPLLKKSNSQFNTCPLVFRHNYAISGKLNIKPLFKERE